jgi:hypothetical protein
METLNMEYGLLDYASQSREVTRFSWVQSMVPVAASTDRVCGLKKRCRRKEMNC